MITFERARITGVEHKIGNSAVTSRIKVSALMTAKIAAELGARYIVMDKEQVVKDGFKSVELETELTNIRVRFDVPKLGKELQMDSGGASGFKVMRKGDGKKKPKKLVVQFKLHYTGSPFDLLEYMIRVGGTEGILSIEELQQKMFPEKTADATESQAKPGKKVKKLSKETRDAVVDGNIADHNDRARGIGPIPDDPNVPEWRTKEEIAAGVPHHISSKVQ